mgnify:CR=1 FL=1
MTVQTLLLALLIAPAPLLGAGEDPWWPLIPVLETGTTEDLGDFGPIPEDLRDAVGTGGGPSAAAWKAAPASLLFFRPGGSLRNEIGLETAAHLTCIAHTRAEVEAILDRVQALGIENIVALRGDQPKDRPAPPLESREFRYAADLVACIGRRDRFAMAVAGEGISGVLIHAKKRV